MPPRRRTGGGWSDPIDLDAPEHAWWARDRNADRPPPAPEPDPDDPYVILKVAPSAPWDEIVSSYRRLARMWHPDGLRDPAPGERELCEDMIRKLNVAYTELRVRRAR
jgi:DnaJ-class molecular chaperone